MSAAAGPWSQRACPDLAAYRPPAPPRPAARLNDRPALYLWAAAAPTSASDAAPSPERLGLTAWQVRLGGELLDPGGLVVPDDLDAGQRAELADWCAGRPAGTLLGRQVPTVLGLTEFCAGPLHRIVYAGRGWLVGADLGRTLALLAEYWAPAAPTRHGGRLSGWAGGWTLGLPGWGLVVERDGRRRWRADTGWPVVRVRALGETGVRVAFGRPPASFEGRRRGAWQADGRAYPGRFFDVIPAADALDGQESGSLADHLAAWGLPLLDDRYALAATPAEAEHAWQVVEAIAALAGRLDAEGSRWAGGLDLPRLTSAASVGSALLRAMGLQAPLETFDLPAGEHAAWMAAFYGGRCEANMPGVLFDGIDADIRSAYPACASILGWWRYVTAASIEAVDFTAEAREMLAGLVATQQTPAGLIRQVLGAGFVRCQVAARGELFPTSTPGTDGQPGLDLRPAYAECLDVTLADAAAASILAGRPVEILSAVRLVPAGRQDGLRAVSVPGLGGELLVLDPETDPVPPLVRLRSTAKASGEQRTARLLRLLLNATVFGQPARVDADRGTVEAPGPWFFPALAASVTGAARLFLAVLQAATQARGGVFAYCDTDGALIPASPPGGLLADGRRILPRAELAEILAGFDGLDPFGDGQPVWSIKAAGPAIAYGAKRWACADPRGLDHTLTGLGDCLPPAGVPDWATAGVGALLDAAAGGKRPALDPALAAWPIMRQEQARRLDALARLPEALGARPFARTVAASNLIGSPAIALDPGGPLAGWAELGWFTADGRRAVLDFDPEAAADWGRRCVIVRPLGDQLRAWAVVAPPADRSPILLLPELRRLVGADSGRFRDGSPQRIVADLDAADLLLRAARMLGPVALAERTGLPVDTAKKLSAGRPPRADTLGRLEPAVLAELAGLLADSGSRACPGCGAPLAGRSRWCSEACRKRSARSAARAPHPCAGCSTPIEGRAKRCPACATLRYRCAGAPWGCSGKAAVRGGWCSTCSADLCVECRQRYADSPGQLCDDCWTLTLRECEFPGCGVRINLGRFCFTHEEAMAR
jgi:hypothetical protein